MDYRNDDPGAVQYGNFINYYQFNSAQDRINLLPDNVWLSHSPTNTDDSYLVLDVGCNSGAVTKLLRQFLTKHTRRKVHILGIDIDPTLIQRAEESNSNGTEVTFHCLDIMEKGNWQTIAAFLSQNGKTCFDAVFCLSITMWIHINNGDFGLRDFLAKCSDISHLFVIEPQPWKCYRTAVRRLQKANDVFDHFANLKWRNNVETQIKNYLEQDLACKRIYEAEPTKWKRKICIYRTNK